MDARLIDHVNKCLGVIPGEISEHLDHLTIGEGGLDQIHTFTCREGGVDQPFPCGRVTRLRVQSSLRPPDE